MAQMLIRKSFSYLIKMVIGAVEHVVVGDVDHHVVDYAKSLGDHHFVVRV